MTEMTNSAQDAVAPMNLASRVVGVFFAPRATYASVAAHPRALGVLVLVTAIAVVVNVIFASTAVGKDALLDVAVRSMESWGMTISDEMYRMMETRVREDAVRNAAIGQVLFYPLASAMVAGLLLGVFTAIMGGDATFKHVFAVVVALELHHRAVADFRHAAELREGYDVGRDQPRRLPSVSRRSVVSRPGFSGRSIFSSSGGW